MPPAPQPATEAPTGATNPMIKPDGVEIVKINSIHVPTELVKGKIHPGYIMVYGLGNDSLLYAWRGQDHKWFLV